MRGYLFVARRNPLRPSRKVTQWSRIRIAEGWNRYVKRNANRDSFSKDRFFPETLCLSREEPSEEEEQWLLHGAVADDS